MKAITLPTKPPFNWKVFLFIAGMLVLTFPAILPVSLTVACPLWDDVGMALPSWLVVTALEFAVLWLSISLGGIGLLLAGRIGLGLPLVEGWFGRESVGKQFRRVLVLSLVVGIAISVFGSGLDLLVFRPLVDAEVDRLGLPPGENASWPVWLMFLVPFTAVWEEVVFRLFGLTLLAWLMRRISSDSASRPSPAVFWIANALVAMVFGPLHALQMGAVGEPLTLLVLHIANAVAFQGLAGLVFGWLYWRWGLESAILAHFSVNMVSTLTALVL